MSRGDDRAVRHQLFVNAIQHFAESSLGQRELRIVVPAFGALPV